jgi:tRNA A-37 threonylcarbamoyl transferase component Bud32
VTAPPIPTGYRRIEESGATLVARDDIADAITAAFQAAPPANRTLHGFAAHVAGARPLQGRETAYALTLPKSSLSVVVRHNRHGGTFRHLTGDVFLGATRAPAELAVALRLESLGIPTPAVVAYGVYPALPGFARSDIVTEEITGASDFAAVLTQTEPKSDVRRIALRAAGQLLEMLAAAGAQHHDLNAKNILIQPTTSGIALAYALDVDRIEFGLPPIQASERNIARLMRSMAKLYKARGIEFNAREIALLAGYHRRLISTTTSS